MHSQNPHSRDPSKTHAYLVGGGIASLSAAALLIRDAQVPPTQIHLYEESAVLGGAMDGSGGVGEGYLIRGGRMLNSSYRCLYDLLQSIPTLDRPSQTVYQEIMDFTNDNQTKAAARLVDNMPIKLDVSRMGFDAKDRINLLGLWSASDRYLGRKAIEDVFHPHFFTTNFWYMWATTFAFQPWHSAIELKRYLHRFIHEFPQISTLAGVDRTVYNQFESIILPISTWLEAQGVDFVRGTVVRDLDFACTSGQVTATKLHLSRDGAPEILELAPTDLVFVTNGSMVSASSIGSMDTAPAVLEGPVVDPAWTLWITIATKLGPTFAGNPSNFLGRVRESQWNSFTVTMTDPALLKYITDFSGNEPGTGALCTFRDSAWLMSIVVPHQPHFRDQPPAVSVFWGYALYVDRPGDLVHKPMRFCTGAEILDELLHHLGRSAQSASLRAGVNVIPAALPYITSQFLTRAPTDRPGVIPPGSTNFAWLGQYTEIPEDTVFTVEYSVRSAMIAVFNLMSLSKTPPPIYKGDHDIEVIYRALEASLT
ncbi:MAG: hypothetical protein M1838_000931 [Thelocarpon superellum]|nr:MAG: hypothetical protein M1838_000931 [Thelocarpon superellum]